jgi:Zn-dependent oligopeptidase
MASRARDNGDKHRVLSALFWVFSVTHAETLNECRMLRVWHRCPLRAWGVIRSSSPLSFFFDFYERRHRARQGTTVQRLGVKGGENGR